MTSQILVQGAEAIISLKNNQISKLRTKKSYRISELDEKIRKSRTKAEAKIIEKLKEVINVPKILKTDEKNREIFMEYIDGKKLSENLEKLDYEEICRQIGQEIAKVHDKDIIHGDLTTSNMIYVENDDNPKNSSSTRHQNLQINKKIKREGEQEEPSIMDNQSSDSEIANSSGKLYFIDFGLGFHSKKIEDKAVDLHLLIQALEAKHFKIAKKAIEIILDNYKANNHKEIIKRIKIIESRGRYKGH